ncbi:hypothetical protein B484DRAFT_472077 [Ochromonadaceae sp. CCMP2298]|nr:hypothetical protein B484DRAFT_472077 [Ochromonadaceae sp. CCMP2298]
MELSPPTPRKFHSWERGEDFIVWRMHGECRIKTRFWRNPTVYSRPSGFLVPNVSGGPPCKNVGTGMFGAEVFVPGECAGEYIGDLVDWADYMLGNSIYGLLVDEPQTGPHGGGGVVLDTTDYIVANKYSPHPCVASRCNSTYLALDTATGKCASTNMQIRAGEDDPNRMFLYCVKRTELSGEFGCEYGDLYPLSSRPRKTSQTKKRASCFSH